MFKRYWWMLLVMAPVGMMAGWVLSAVLTYMMPKKFESHAIIEVIPRTSANAGFPHSPPNGADLGTEIEIMKSRNTLSKVSEILDLPRRWDLDRDSALMILKSVVKTEQLSGTDLIDIRVRHTNKEDARDIARETARAYKEYRQDIASAQSEKLTNELRKVVWKKENKVEELKKILGILSKTRTSQEINPNQDDDYMDYKRDLVATQAMLDQLRLDLSREEINQEISTYHIVVHEEPVIADMPISPNVTLNLVRGSVFGALVSPLLALPLMWWMNRRKR